MSDRPRYAWGLALLAGSTMAAPIDRPAAEPAVTVLPLPFEVAEFRGPGSRIAELIASTDGFRDARGAIRGPRVVVWGRDGSAVATVENGAIRTRVANRAVGDLPALERGRYAAPGSRVEAAGALLVQLEDASRDYPHEALGSGLHPRVLSIVERKPQPPSAEPKPVRAETSRVEAGEGAVFEDREPHLADLDGDGTPEIVVVRSYRDRGSALAVVGRRDGRWGVVAETLPDGEPFRWLNPVPPPRGGASGIVALVRRPHLDGVVQVFRLRDGKLSLVAERAGYANHAYGSAQQDLAASLPPGRGAIARFALPTLDRRAMAILDVYDGRIDETSRIALPARAATGVAALDAGGRQHLLVGLEDGRLVTMAL